MGKAYLEPVNYVNALIYLSYSFDFKYIEKRKGRQTETTTWRNSQLKEDAAANAFRRETTSDDDSRK